MENRNSTLWLIPARGGSKGIPGKNLKKFCGKSLVGRAVEQALQCARPADEVLVSTDSPEIAEEARNFGCEIPFMRPDALATDTAATYDVILHALDEFRKRGKEFSKVVLLQPTSPLREITDIEQALSLWEPEIDMVVSVVPAKTNPYYNAFETNQEGFLEISKGPGTYTRRQDAPPVWEYNGAVYVMNVKSLLQSPMSGFKKIIPSPMDSSRSIDLDTPVDWLIAETLYKNKKTE